MKVLTVLGTRPEFIRLSRIIARLDGLCRHVVVHTGQNYDPNLDSIFFRELQIRAPDYHFEARGSFAEQLSSMLPGIEKILRQECPDRFLVLGDTNSSLCAVIAKRLGIPVYHMEAGNRCYDDRVPEEVNRRLIDHASDVLMPYTHRSKENLLREGIARQRIFVIGNPIYEVLRFYAPQIEANTALERFGLAPGQYLLATIHRAENVDDPERLGGLLAGLQRAGQECGCRIIVSLHPHTRGKIAQFGLHLSAEGLTVSQPLGFFEFSKLERHARCVLTDSGTVQEECAILGIPNVTLRDSTERAETVECGSGVLAGADPEMISQAVEVALSSASDWHPPTEYLEPRVSDVVTKIVLGFRRSPELHPVRQQAWELASA
jgi:UDP-N-acetylglucosamine 2-epimerase (non-hydrolysing)